MLPILNAISVIPQSLKGGTTHPSIMLVEDSNGEIFTYVVKVFTQKQEQQQKATAKEIYASVLASEFDLSTPSSALINVSFSIIEQLKLSGNFDNKEIINGYYFGCEYIENNTDFSELTSSKILDNWEIELIFAFDCLIFNIDRRIGKPNIFFAQSKAYLIDHELSLKENLIFQKMININAWEILKSSRKHIFLNLLRDSNNHDILKFETFQEYLKMLNPNILKKYGNQLEELEVESGNYLEIIAYLEKVKQNWNTFYEILMELINNE